MTVLVDYDRYVAVTGDRTTAPDVVRARLARATTQVEEALRRPLTLAERTEVVKPVGAWGRVIPSVTPVISVGAPSAVEIEFAGYGLRNVTIDPTLVLGTGEATLTYTAGYDADTVPEVIVETICELAVAMGVAETGDRPVSSVSVGLIRVSYADKSGSSTADAIRARLPGWWRR